MLPWFWRSRQILNSTQLDDRAVPSFSELTRLEPNSIPGAFPVSPLRASSPPTATSTAAPSEAIAPAAIAVVPEPLL